MMGNGVSLTTTAATTTATATAIVTIVTRGKHEVWRNIDTAAGRETPTVIVS